jgi:hypothetical protein
LSASFGLDVAEDDDKPDVYAGWIKSLEDSAERVLRLSGLVSHEEQQARPKQAKPRPMPPQHPGKRLARLLLHPDEGNAYRTLLLVNCFVRYDASLEPLTVFLNHLTHKFVWVSIGKVIEVRADTKEDAPIWRCG